MSKPKPLRILAYDTSLGRPGAAVIEIANRRAKITAVSHVSTTTAETYAQRTTTIEAWAHLFTRENYGKRGYDAIVREAFAGKIPATNYAIFSAWSAVDRALANFGLSFTEKAIGQATVKRLVVGRGKAEKAEVEAAVRALTGYTSEFAVDDESDAAAIGLAFAINAGLIDKLTEGDG